MGTGRAGIPRLGFWVLASLGAVLVCLVLARLSERGHPTQSLSTDFSPPLSVTPTLPLQKASEARHEIPSSQRLVRVLVVGGRAEAPIHFASLRLWRGSRDTGAGTQLSSDSNGIALVDLEALRGAHLSATAEGWFPCGQTVPADYMGDEWKLRMHVAGEMRVRVTDETGAPVKSAFVQIFPEPNGQPMPEVWPSFAYIPDTTFDSPLSIRSVTDADGWVVVQPLPCDTPLRVEASIVVPETATVAAIPEESRSAEVVLVAPAHGCIAGRLLWSNGTPASVLLQPLVGSYPEHSRLSYPAPDGTFRLCGLPFGPVRWRVLAPGQRIRIANVEVGKDTDVGIIELPPQGVLKGVLRSAKPENSWCLPRVKIELAQAGRPVATDWPGEDGSFEVEVTFGQTWYQLQIEQGLVLADYVDVPGPPLLIDFDEFVGALDIELRGRGSGIGRMVLVDTLRGPGAGMEYPLDSPYARRMEDPERWRLAPVLPGEYEVFLRRDGALTSLGEVQIVAGRTAVLATTAGAAARVVIRTCTASGRPVPNVPVRAVPRLDGRLIDFVGQTGYTAGDGKTEFALFAGNWEVAAFWPDTAATPSRVLTVTDDERIEISYTLPEGLVVRGRVRYGQEPVPGRRVVLYPAGQAILGVNVRETITDDQGIFDFNSVAPGEYGLNVTTAEWSGERRGIVRPLQVLPHRDCILEIDLSAPTTRVQFLLDGEQLTFLQKVVAFSSSYKLTQQLSSGSASVADLPLEEGPHVFLVYPRNAPRLEQENCVAVQARWIAPRELNVIEIEGARLSVSCTTPDGCLPILRLLSVGSIGLGGTSPGPLLTYEDTDHGREFSHIPVGSSVQLESWSPWGEQVIQNMRIDGTGTYSIFWPPAD